MTRMQLVSRERIPSQAGVECERIGYFFYRDVFGGWRWEFRQPDGDFIDSRESYESKEECVVAAHRAARALLPREQASLSG